MIRSCCKRGLLLLSVFVLTVKKGDCSADSHYNQLTHTVTHNTTHTCTEQRCGINPHNHHCRAAEKVQIYIQTENTTVVEKTLKKRSMPILVISWGEIPLFLILYSSASLEAVWTEQQRQIVRMMLSKDKSWRRSAVNNGELLGLARGFTETWLHLCSNTTDLDRLNQTKPVWAHRIGH